MRAVLPICQRAEPRLCVCSWPATLWSYRLSLHDALPISPPLRALLERHRRAGEDCRRGREHVVVDGDLDGNLLPRSEEHTSELQSRRELVCRLLLEKKKIRR